MGIEKLATSAVETAIEKTDRLNSFINSGDKEPCWDGNIYIPRGKTTQRKTSKKLQHKLKERRSSLTKWLTPSNIVFLPMTLLHT